MDEREHKTSQEILDYQPDAVEIEERPVPGKIRWVLYIIFGSLVLTVIAFIVFKVDRIVAASGEIITTTPNIVVQSINTAIIRSIDVQVGDVVEEGQILATLDHTFANADLSQSLKQSIALKAQIRRIEAEIDGGPFVAKPEEGEDGGLQEQILRQHTLILEKKRKTVNDKLAALNAQVNLFEVRRQGQEQQLKVLRDVEGTIAKFPKKDNEQRIRLLEAQKARYKAVNTIEDLTAEEKVTLNEIKQTKSDWSHWIEEKKGDLLDQKVRLRYELDKVEEELLKAKRMNELVSLRAPEPGVVLNLEQRTVGSITRQAEPFITLVPQNSSIEVEISVLAKDIGRIRTGDEVRVKLDAFPFQRHGTLPGKIRVISGDAFHLNAAEVPNTSEKGKVPANDVYQVRVDLLSNKLTNVPDGFRLMPGMKVRAEIKIGKRSVISYFLYPVIRALDESLREP